MILINPSSSSCRKASLTGELVKEIKRWVDEEYAGGRVTVLTDEEIVKCVERVCGELGLELPGRC